MGPLAVRSPEVVAGRSSKRKLDDEEICTSAHKVGSIDDLLIQILLRLPLTSLRRSKSVCKRWSSLINDPRFRLLRSRNLNADHPSGLFIQLKTAPSEFAFLQLDPVNRSPLITIKSFPFYLNSGDIDVLQSCNGLLLCFIWPDKFYVYIPTLNLCKLLPLPHVWLPSRHVSGIAIAYDPKVSPHYKIMYPYEDDDVDDFTSPVRIEIYSSETGNWTSCAQTFDYIYFMGFDMGINWVYWNGAIHWIDLSGEVYHFNIQNPNFIQVETPKSLVDKAFLVDKLLVSGDCLLLVKMVSLAQMNVYEIKYDYSGWSFKYHVNLADISTFQPGNFVVLSIVLSESEREDGPGPFLVLEVSGKLIQFNIISQTFGDICDLATIRPRNTNLCSFFFTPSLAGV